MASTNYKLVSINDICCFRSLREEGIRVFWEITRRCNFDCIYCQIVKKDLEELSIKKCIQVIKDLKKINVKKIKFTGGEPLLKEGLLELCAAAKECKIGVDITTNAFLADRSFCESILRSEVECLSVNLPGATKKTFEKMSKRPYSFKRVIDNVKNAIGLGISIDTNTVVCKLNFKEIGDIIDFCNKIKVRSVNLIGLFWVGRALENEEDLVLSLHEMEKVRRLVECKRKIYKDLFIRTTRLLAQPPFKSCPAGKNLVGINYGGRVLTCLNLDTGVLDSLPNLHKEGIMNILKSDCYQNEVKKFQEVDSCSNIVCKYKRKCGKGCRGAALYTYGDVLAPDPLCQLFQYGEIGKYFP